ncbi:hypothetical protein F2P56_021842 [Juglans regia]|uniref:Uncharacterized protein n=1 Tax=Juglans regia TaxID=51240 RepID=A0A833X370_JUGRE|nr:hypothetical protein F2P56_021842 [Juglans regia]
MTDRSSVDCLPPGWTVEVSMDAGRRTTQVPPICHLLPNLSPAVAKKQKLELSSAGEHIKLDERMIRILNLSLQKNVTILRFSAGRLDTNFSSPHLPEAKDSEKIGGKSDFAENVSVSAPAVGLHPAIQSLKSKGKMHENEKTQLGMRKSRKKKEYNLPRWASKRLAGLGIDPTPELNATRAWQFGSLAHRASLKPAELEARVEGGSNFGSQKSTKVLESTNYTHGYEDLTAPIGHTGNIRRESKDEQKDESPTILPVANSAILEEYTGKVENGKEGNEKPDILVDLLSLDPSHDPCIQFAIKNLTGIGIDS